VTDKPKEKNPLVFPQGVLPPLSNIHEDTTHTHTHTLTVARKPLSSTDVMRGISLLYVTVGYRLCMESARNENNMASVSVTV